MEQRVSAVTLGVEDIPRATKFYEDLGFKRHPSSNKMISFFQMNGFVFGLFGRQDLANEAAKGNQGIGFGNFALAYNTRSKDEVEPFLRTAEAAGGTIEQAAHDTFWGGYAGYFADPDGHRWEVAWNDSWPISEEGNVSID
jgi:predicted lactoylglutathione lyase